MALDIPQAWRPAGSLTVSPGWWQDEQIRKGTAVVQPLEEMSFDRHDEVREGENWRLELVNLAGDAEVGRLTLQPGWRWSQDVKPVAGTDWCMAPHQS